MKNRTFQIFFLFLLFIPQITGAYTITRVEPPCWWAGMKNKHLELMVYGPSISDLEPAISDRTVNILEITRVDNPNYVFILLEIGENIFPHSFKIYFEKDGENMVTHIYQILQRDTLSAGRKGFDNSDVVLLITPDRFANGDTANDNIPGYSDLANRSSIVGRHGGDLKGISDHIDYISGMGYSALWLNPVLENNMPRTSYHGYAITDFYKVDPRFGTNEEYKQLSERLRQQGIKLIMDMVENHCGSGHWWMKDLPTDDWINFGGKFVQTNHRRTTVQDPHAAQKDKILFEDGWFARAMPDLNQKNPHMARYLIQNSIWWIEYAGLSGIRQDTYSYPDKDFMTQWSCAIMDEYPNFSIVGEEWSLNPAIIAYWQKGKTSPDGYTSCLGSLMDFPLQDALVKGLTEKEDIHSDGLIRMYEALANDFQYADPDRLMIFPDNHDMNRFFTQVNENYDLFRIGLAYILTMRGIPQIFYGTEILMTSPLEKTDGLIRSDFPGGWPGDAVDAFTGTGLTGRQLEAQEYLRTLINWRKTKSCIHDGALVHYTPEKGTYVYFRFNDTEKIMVVINKSPNTVELDGARFSEYIGSAISGKDLISNIIYDLHVITVPAMSALILEL